MVIIKALLASFLLLSLPLYAKSDKNNDVSSVNQARTSQHPLDVVVSVKFASSIHNVEKALVHLLRKSGYKLQLDEDSKVISSYKLPKSQYQIGPVRLREALKMLIGEAWVIKVDEVNRTINIIRGDYNFSIYNPVSLAPKSINSTKLDEVILVDFLKGVSLESSLVGDKEKRKNNGILPEGWRVDFSGIEDNRHKDIVVKVVSESKTRREVANKVLDSQNMAGYFYPKMKLLVVKEK